jgi:hypothetical protein
VADLDEHIASEEYCACDSLESLAKWFKGFIRALNKESFHISVYETKHARVGRYGQVVFVKDKAKRVERISWYQAAKRRNKNKEDK